MDGTSFVVGLVMVVSLITALVLYFGGPRRRRPPVRVNLFTSEGEQLLASIGYCKTYPRLILWKDIASGTVRYRYFILGNVNNYDEIAVSEAVVSPEEV